MPLLQGQQLWNPEPTSRSGGGLKIKKKYPIPFLR